MKIVRTFATSANLGPGFDCLGICFNLYNEYEFFPSNEYKIEGFNKKFSNPNDNLIIKSYERVFLLKNKKIQFLTIKQKIQNIPLSRGLGHPCFYIKIQISALRLLFDSILRYAVLQ